MGTRVEFRLGPWINVFLLCILQPLRVRGCILTLVERMDEEFTKIMQNTDPHSQGKPKETGFGERKSAGFISTKVRVKGQPWGGKW